MEKLTIKRCSKCILPENYPGITFDEDNICNYCKDHKEFQYRGVEALREKINTSLTSDNDRNKEYDCVIGFSDGRDSTYLLHFLVKTLNLNVIAYTAKHDFIPETTMLNMKYAAEILNVKHIIEESDLLKRCLRHTLSSWIYKPSAAMIETFCTG